MAERTKPYRIRTQDGIIVRGIPPGVDPSDPSMVRTVQNAREKGDKDVLYPYIQETELAKGIVEGGKRVGLNLAEMVGLVEPETVERFEAEAAMRPRSMGRSVGQVGTEVVGTAGVGGPVGGALAHGVRAIPWIPRVAPVLGLSGRGAVEGATEGAILAGPGERASGAQRGALTGAAVGGGLGFLSGGFRTPDEAAQRLLDMGVDLTPGQMKPQGTINLLEQTIQELPLLGPGMRASRQSAQEDFAAAMVNASRPPGAPRLPKEKFHDMTDRAYAQFQPAYEVAKGFPVYRGWDEALSDTFKRITEIPDILAEEGVRKMINTFLQAKLSRVKRKAERNAQGLVDSGDLLSIRTDIRDKLRELRKGAVDNKAASQIEMLDLADNAITWELTKQLPHDIMPFVRDIDRQYAKFKIVQQAAADTLREGPPTPFQWGRAAHKNASLSQRAGKTGLFMPETQAAMEVFETTAPRTGARNITMGAVGGSAGMYTDPLFTGSILGSLALLGQTRTGRLMSSGIHPLQQGVQGLLDQMPASAVSTLGAIARATPVVLGQQ